MTPTTVAFAPSARAHVARAVTAALVALASGGAQAAFFQLAENSPAGLGNAFAGGAAIAEDASTVWYNPAGLTRLSGTQLVLGGHYIKPSLEASDVSGTTATGTAITGGSGGDAGEAAFVPNFYYAQRYSDQLSFGLGVNAPFGLATDYDGDWTGRYHADRSEITTININPSVAYRINDAVSIGGGINWQKLDAELSQAVDFGTVCYGALGPVTCNAIPGGGLQPTQDDGKATVTADDDAWGYNFGMLWQLSNEARLGLHYRSEIDYDLSGSVNLNAPANVPAALQAAAGSGSNAKASVTIPATLSLSAFTQISPQWAIMGDITRTYWGDLPELRVEFSNAAAPDSVVTLDLNDVNRYSVGATYSPGGAWMYRFGVALDESPTPNAEVRTPRLPDADRTWFSFGAGYKTSDKISFDIAYTYIKVDDASVEKSASGEDASRGSLVADYEATTQILSGQVNWKF